MNEKKIYEAPAVEEQEINNFIVQAAESEKDKDDNLGEVGDQGGL